jgi:hypothetical protein
MPAFPPGVHLKGGRNAAPVLAEMAREFYAPIIPIVMELHGQGLSLRAIAAELERRKIKSRWGWPRWSAAQVMRILARGLAAAESEPQVSQACATAPPANQQTPPSAARIHLLIDHVDMGPFTDSQIEAMLNAGEITPETLFWRDGTEGWQPLHTIISVHLRLGGESKGPFTESQVREMLAKRLIGLGTLGRRNSKAEWEPLETLIGVPGAKPAQTTGARPVAAGSNGASD